MSDVEKQPLLPQSGATSTFGNGDSDAHPQNSGKNIIL